MKGLGDSMGGLRLADGKDREVHLRRQSLDRFASVWVQTKIRAVVIRGIERLRLREECAFRDAALNGAHEVVLIDSMARNLATVRVLQVKGRLSSPIDEQRST